MPPSGRLFSFGLWAAAYIPSEKDAYATVPTTLTPEQAAQIQADKKAEVCCLNQLCRHLKSQGAIDDYYYSQDPFEAWDVCLVKGRQNLYCEAKIRHDIYADYLIEKKKFDRLHKRVDELEKELGRKCGRGYLTVTQEQSFLWNLSSTKIDWKTETHQKGNYCQDVKVKKEVAYLPVNAALTIGCPVLYLPEIAVLQKEMERVDAQIQADKKSLFGMDKAELKHLHERREELMKILSDCK